MYDQQGINLAKDLIEQIEKAFLMANILGIDYGQKYIGYAIGNDITLTSSTQGTIFLQKSKKTTFKKYKI